MAYKDKEKQRETQKRYRENHKKEQLEWQRNHYAKHKEEISEHRKQWRENNKEKKKEQSATYYKNNKEKVREDNKCYLKNNPEKPKEYSNRYRMKNPEKLKEERLKRNHGLTMEEYNQLIQLQNNRCVICTEEFNTKDRRACVDHNHKTGKIREILCNQCNSALGFLKENIATMQSMIEYVQKHNT